MLLFYFKDCFQEIKISMLVYYVSFNSLNALEYFRLYYILILNGPVGNYYLPIYIGKYISQRPNKSLNWKPYLNNKERISSEWRISFGLVIPGNN